ncbi:hypothetical protein [Polaromonas sp. YR568]|uniref:hypothetical protein n=1 Tax=Polaromonas sp. YR568 TaxID=1855301 RepID=UPI00398C1403
MKISTLLSLVMVVCPAFAQGSPDCAAQLGEPQFSSEQKYLVQRLLSIEPPPANSPLVARFWTHWPVIQGADKEGQIRCWRSAVNVLANLQRSFWSDVTNAYRNGDGSMSVELTTNITRLADLPAAAKALLSVPEASAYKTHASEFLVGVAARKEVVWMGTKIPPHVLDSYLDTGNWTRVEQFFVQGIAAQ